MTTKYKRKLVFKPTLALNEAIDRAIESDRCNESYSGKWLRVDTLRKLLKVPYRVVDFEPMGRRLNVSSVNLTEAESQELLAISPILLGEPETVYGFRVLASALVQLGYLSK